MCVLHHPGQYRTPKRENYLLWWQIYPRVTDKWRYMYKLYTYATQRTMALFVHPAIVSMVKRTHLTIKRRQEMCVLKLYLDRFCVLLCFLLRTWLPVTMVWPTLTAWKSLQMYAIEIGPPHTFLLHLSLFIMVLFIAFDESENRYCAS